MTDKPLTREEIEAALKDHDSWEGSTFMGERELAICRTALALMDERDKYKRLIETANNQCGCHFDETGEEVLTWCAAHAAYRKEAEAKYDALAAAEAELREACIKEDRYSEDSNVFCAICLAYDVAPMKIDGHHSACRLSRPANECGKELLEKARKYDEAFTRPLYARLRAENARLREAFEIITGLHDMHGKEVVDAVLIAKAALRGEQGEA